MIAREVVATAIAWIALTSSSVGQPLRPFTVASGIELAHFSQVGAAASPIIFSPNGRMVAVLCERGLLKRDLVEDEVRIYDMRALQEFVGLPEQHRRPGPLLDLREATYKEGPVITQIRWLRDSSGLAFLLRTGQNTNELMTAGVGHARLKALSLIGQNVTSFDINDATHYVYSVLSPGRAPPCGNRSLSVAWDATGHSLADILLCEEIWTRVREGGGLQGGAKRSVLWAALGGVPHLVTRDGRPIVFFPASAGTSLVPPSLSPDGITAAAALPVLDVPEDWIERFRPPFAGDPYDVLRAGRQDLNALIGDTLIVEYALIDLRTGGISIVDDAPAAAGTGWFSTGTLTWSEDGKALLLPDVYAEPADSKQSPALPCVAIFYPGTKRVSCLVVLDSPMTKHGGLRSDVRYIRTLRFADNTSNKVVIKWFRASTLSTSETAVYSRSRTGVWKVDGATEVPRVHEPEIRVYIKEDLNDPPTLTASSAGRSREIWDPNPQLKGVALGHVSVYHWKDATGRRWAGGLYWPTEYMAGKTYPLVIQTHGFNDKIFSSSGIYPTAFAARPLAASGIFVLQVPLCPEIQNPKSGPCETAAYSAAVMQLTSQKLIDPARVGIIGFSYTVYAVLDALTGGGARFAAASITDGWNYGYWEYLTDMDASGNLYQQVANATLGAKPFGLGLRAWVSRAPDFNMQKIHTPLLVNALSRSTLLGSMWEPYALLRYLRKPVDLVLFDSDEHVLSNPASRVASQSGSVDWFRFWLQGHKSSDLAKAGQYRRWARLCEMQKAEGESYRTACVP